jgi:hypothetical protein
MSLYSGLYRQLVHHQLTTHAPTIANAVCGIFVIAQIAVSPVVVDFQCVPVIAMVLRYFDISHKNSAYKNGAGANGSFSKK